MEKEVVFDLLALALLEEVGETLFEYLVGEADSAEPFPVLDNFLVSLLDLNKTSTLIGGGNQGLLVRMEDHG